MQVQHQHSALPLDVWSSSSTWTGCQVSLLARIAGPSAVLMSQSASAEMGQVTTKLGQGADAAGLRAAHAVLNGPKASKQAWMTFVVPPDKFATFKRQEMSGPLDRKFNIRQHVMKMPLVSQATFMPSLRFC